MTGAVAAAGWAAACAAVLIALVSLAELRRRSELVARACHELRGPLTAGSLALHGIARDAEAPVPRVAGVDLELRRAALALDDLHEAVHGRRGRDRHETVDVTELVARQAAAWRDIARAAGRELTVRESVPDAVVRGCELRLAQATGNLIANALEHGRGGIDLSVRAAGGRVRVEVADRGPGLPAGVDELAARARSGRGPRGRGLAIASEIARRHGGRLAAAPSGGGARIALDLPSGGKG